MSGPKGEVVSSTLANKYLDTWPNRRAGPYKISDPLGVDHMVLVGQPQMADSVSKNTVGAKHKKDQNRDRKTITKMAKISSAASNACTKCHVVPLHYISPF